MSILYFFFFLAFMGDYLFVAIDGVFFIFSTYTVCVPSQQQKICRNIQSTTIFFVL